MVKPWFPVDFPLNQSIESTTARFLAKVAPQNLNQRDQRRGSENLTANRGDRSPLAGTPCECHYAGTTPSLTPDAIEKAIDLGTSIFGYGSISINTIFSGMNIHLPSILMWTTGVLLVLTHCHLTSMETQKSTKNDRTRRGGVVPNPRNENPTWPLGLTNFWPIP